MPFLKRLGFYLIGLSIGLIFLAIFLRKKSEETGTEFCYLPNCRVLKELRSKPLGYSPKVQALMADGAIDSAAIAHFLREGDVKFGQSDTKARPCKAYVIEGRHGEEDRLLDVRNCQDSTLIDNLR